MTTAPRADASSPDPGRQWLKVHIAWLSHPDWIELTIEQFGAAIILQLLANGNTPRGSVPSEKWAVWAVRRQMGPGDKADPQALVDALIEKGMLSDPTGEGTLVLSDADIWQGRAPSALPHATAARQRKHREQKVAR